MTRPPQPRSPRRSGTRPGWRVLPGLLGCLLAAGCAGYRLGPTNGLDPGARSVQVQPFVNQTYEPRLSEPVTHALRKQFQQDGTFRVATRGDGDIVVTGTLMAFQRNPLTLQPNDVFSTRDYEVRLTAHVKAEERASGRVVFDRTVMGRTTIRNAPDLNSAERQAAPLLAEELARNISALLIDGSW